MQTNKSGGKGNNIANFISLKCLNINWQAKINSGKWILEVTCLNGKWKF
jgi:hypothetical protein